MDRENLIQAVIDALTADDDQENHQHWTTQELCDQLGWGVEKMRGALLALKRSGKLGVTRKNVESLSGYTTQVPAYFLLEENHENDQKGTRAERSTSP